MTITSFPVIGIILAVVSAALLTLGNHLQSRGVAASTRAGSASIGASQAWALVRQPVWLAGTALFGAAILVQLGALAFAPLIVVQPVGVVALVFASLLTARLTHTAPSVREIVSIAVCVVSLGIFVTVAASVSDQTTITDAQLIAVLIVLLVTLAATFALVALRRGKRVPPVAYVLLGGLYSGFVATLGKTVILRVQTALHNHDYRIDDEPADDRVPRGHRRGRCALDLPCAARAHREQTRCRRGRAHGRRSVRRGDPRHHRPQRSRERSGLELRRLRAHRRRCDVGRVVARSYAR